MMKHVNIAVACLLLHGCGLKNLAAPKDSLRINTPDVWKAAENRENREISSHWLDEFHDPVMRRTVNDALSHNQNLQAAASRLRVAKELSIQARAARLPRANLGSSLGASVSDSDITERYGLSFAASWEPDLWGRLRNLDRAGAADFEAAVAEFRNAKLSLAALSAKSYCNLISAQQQSNLAVVTLESFQKNLRIIERNYKAGIPSVRALDVQLGRTNVSSTQRSVTARQLDRDETARNLEVLLGRYPTATLQAAHELPEISDSIPLGIPATLIERRPDLAAARSRIFASSERAKAAKKNLLPDISLSAGSGTSRSVIARLFDTQSLVTSITASLSQVLYNGGANVSEVRAALARNDAAIHDYAQLSLEAFREVESALATESSLAVQVAFLNKEVEQAALAEKQAERDYSEGIEGVDILSVLESQRRANNARSALIRLKNERLQARIDLHVALGGSF
jgi:multidrug efflux system outer membrane protein